MSDVNYEVGNYADVLGLLQAGRRVGPGADSLEMILAHAANFGDEALVTPSDFAAEVAALGLSSVNSASQGDIRVDDDLVSISEQPAITRSPRGFENRAQRAIRTTVLSATERFTNSKTHNLLHGVMVEEVVQRTVSHNLFRPPSFPGVKMQFFPIVAAPEHPFGYRFNTPYAWLDFDPETNAITLNDSIDGFCFAIGHSPVIESGIFVPIGRKRSFKLPKSVLHNVRSTASEAS